MIQFRCKLTEINTRAHIFIDETYEKHAYIYEVHWPLSIKNRHLFRRTSDMNVIFISSILVPSNNYISLTISYISTDLDIILLKHQKWMKRLKTVGTARLVINIVDSRRQRKHFIHSFLYRWSRLIMIYWVVIRSLNIYRDDVRSSNN